MTHKRKLAHVTFQPIENDGRVKRALTCLNDAGYDCSVVPEQSEFVEFEFGFFDKVRIAVTFGLSALLGVRAARKAFFSIPMYNLALSTLLEQKPNAIHAHDWDGLIVAEQAAKILGIPFIYDSHELATYLHMERRLWRWTIAPMVRLLETDTINQAKAVIVVSDRQGDFMLKAFSLTCPVTTVRNIIATPSIEELEHRQEQDPILLHYHGILAFGRGLEQSVQALSIMPQHIRLRLTGPVRQQSFKKKIDKLIAKSGVSERVDIRDVVRNEDLIDHAKSADIGLCLLPMNSQHNQIAQPNKVFEYLKAGLAVIVSGSKELHWIEKAGAGRVLESGSAEELAACLKDVTHQEVFAMRQCALELGRSITWQDEKINLIKAWAAIDL